MHFAGRLALARGRGAAAGPPPLRSHALPWDFGDGGPSTSGSDSDDDGGDAGSWGGASSDAAGAISPTPSGESLASAAGGLEAPAAERQPLVCDFKEVSARLKGAATAQVDLQVRP